MATIWEQLYPLLSEEKKEEWAKRYKKKFGKDFVPPGKAVQLESLEEMKEIMEETPSYPLDVQGRER